MFRASDGMMLAERQQCTLVFGEDPNAPPSNPKRKQSRLFIESDPEILQPGQAHWNTMGSRYMRVTVANNDILGVDLATRFDGVDAAVIEERCQEGSVILAPDSLDMRTNGGGMNAVNMKTFNKSVKAN